MDGPLTNEQRALGWGGCHCHFSRTFREGGSLRQCHTSYRGYPIDRWYWFADPNVHIPSPRSHVPRGYADSRSEAMAQADEAMLGIVALIRSN